MNRTDLLQRLAGDCAHREQSGLLRQLQAVETIRTTRVRRHGRELVVFCSNDYLGLAQHPDIVDALRRSAAECGVGSTGSHLVCGHHREHCALEETLAEWTGRERALLFSSGMMANFGVLQTLLRRSDVCVQDKLNHASLMDAARLSGATLRRYAHADAEHAAHILDRHAQRPALLISDGVFSMDGDLAPLSDLATVCRIRQTSLMIDDAHGLGVLGRLGAGSVAAAGLDAQAVPILMGTLGKALGCSGAFIAGSATLIEGLLQFARSYIYTTAMPPALAAAAHTAVRIVQQANELRDRLQHNIQRFRTGAMQLGLPMLPSSTPIQPLLIGDPGRAVDAALQLEQARLLVTAIRPPSVPQGQDRLRITLSAAHHHEDIDRLLEALGNLRPALSAWNR